MYELLLTSVAIAGVYWGQFFLRKRPHGTATFGYMQLAMGLLAILGVWANRGGPAPFGVAGAIGLGMGACLLVVGPAVRGLGRRFAMADRLGIAKRLLDVAEILNPGAGVGEEKALLGAMSEIRAGHIDQTIEALATAREREGRDARRAIDERIAMLYLAAYRWTDAIAHAEAHLFADPVADGDPKSPSLRDALGLAPPVWVELLGAYGRTGDLDRAARMLDRLELACDGRPDGGVWVHRARMMFLALGGRPSAVQAMVARDKARHMSDAARSYWIAVAHEHTGDRAAATAAYAKARARSRGKPREMIDRAVAQLRDAKPVAPSATAAEALARAEAAPIPATPVVARARGPWAAPMLTASCVLVAATIAIVVGPSQDIGVLVRAGASVRGLVADGEWWRLVACIFIHVGAIHLMVNAIGLWFIGRLAEDIFGAARTIAIFAVAGVAGAVTSYLASPGGVSAGASGAIFGLLGAVFAELTFHRAHYRAAWKRGVWSSLAIVTVAQIAIDFAYPIIDQWAHGAGLVGGALIGVVLSPRVRWARFGLYAARSLAIVFGVAAIFAAVMVAITPLTASLSRDPATRHVVGELAVIAPANWRTGVQHIADPDEIVETSLARLPAPQGADKAAADWIAGTPSDARHKDEDTVDTAAAIVPLPAGWTGAEFVAGAVDAMDYRQQTRVIAAVRAIPGSGDVIAVRIYVPDSVARAMPAALAQLLATIGPAQ